MSTAVLDQLDLPTRNRVENTISTAIGKSLSDGTPQTQSEIKHRFNHCLSLIGVMRHDLGWSWTRIHDNLPFALRSMLDSGEWDPPTRNSWNASAESGLILPSSAT